VTVIVAARTEDGIVMACDSQTSAGWHKMERDVPKLWVTGEWLFGAAGSVRAAQVVRHHTSWPKYRPDEEYDFEAFAVKKIIPAIRTAARDNGALETSAGIESVGCSLLGVIDGNIVEFGHDGSVVCEPSGRMAIGSGYAQALGHLDAIDANGVHWCENDVVNAVRAAIKTNGGCGGPVQVVNDVDMEIRTL